LQIGAGDDQMTVGETPVELAIRQPDVFFGKKRQRRMRRRPEKIGAGNDKSVVFVDHVFLRQPVKEQPTKVNQQPCRSRLRVWSDPAEPFALDL